jgi:hypothetical protein
MKTIPSLLRATLLTCAAAGLAVPGEALAAGYAPLNASYGAQNKPSGDQSEARREMRAGNAKSLREIERMILPTMEGAEYLGPAYDSVAHAYRLKFIRKGRVMYVDVDARTGRIINRSG